MMANQLNRYTLGFTRTQFSIFVFIVCFFIVMRFWRLTAYGLWFDEAFSLHAARLGWHDLIRFVGRDVVHPPLFYMLLKVWIKIGGEFLLWLKLLPVLTSIASIIPFLLLCRELRLSGRVINTVLTLIAITSYFVHYAQEVRMYSPLLFLTLCSLWLFSRLINSPISRSQLFVLFVANLLLVYTHYFGWFVVVSELSYVLFWKRKLFVPLLMKVIALFLCYVPWIYIVARALIEKKGLGENLGWIDRPRLYEFIYYYARLHGTFEVRHTAIFSLILFGCPLLFWSWQVARRNSERTPSILLWGMALFAFLPAVLAFVASYFLPQSVWGERHLVISAVPYLLVIVTAIYKLETFWVRVTLVILIVTWAGLSNLDALRRDDVRMNWSELSRMMVDAEPAQAGMIKVYTTNEFIASPIKFGLQSLGERRFDVIAGSDMFGRRKFDLMTAVADSQAAHFWVAFRQMGAVGNREQAIQDKLRGNGCLVGQEFSVGTSNQRIIFFPVDCPQ